MNWNSIFEKQLTPLNRTLIAAAVSMLTFYLGMHKYKSNQIFMPFWQRDYSNITHGLFNFGHTGKEMFFLPTATITLASSLLVFILIYKALLKYPEKLSLHFLMLVVLDFLVMATFVNIFIFSGSGSDLVYYAGSFAAGAYLFGTAVVSRYAFLAIVLVVMVRLIFVQDLYPFANFIPLLILLYAFLRAPFESESFMEEMRAFSLGKVLNKEQGNG